VDVGQRNVLPDNEMDVLVGQRNYGWVYVKGIYPQNHGGCKGPGCPSGYDAGLTNQTSLVRFEFFIISCDSNQIHKWFGTHYNLEVPL